MISTPRRSVSYPVLVEICRFLPYGQRAHIAKSNALVRRIHSRLDFTIKSLKFHQKCENLDGETGEVPENPNAWIRICTDEKENSIDYIFIWDEMQQKTEILCSLAPGKSIFVDEKDACQIFLKFFIENSKTPIEHVELFECNKPFRNFTTENLTIPTLHWIVNKGNDEKRFANFADDHVFEKLELENIRLYLLAEKHVRNAKFLKIRNEEVYEEFEENQEMFNMIHFFGRLKNQLVDVEFRLANFSTFCAGCDVLIQNNMTMGSKFTGHFDAPIENPVEKLKNILVHKVSNKTVDGRECVVLEVGDEFVVAIFSDSLMSFMAVKMSRSEIV